MIKLDDIVGLNPTKLGYKLLDPKILKDPLSVKMILDLNPVIPIDDVGRSPLHYVAQNGQLKVCELLVEYGLDINQQDEEGCSPLHLAIINSKIRTVKFLVSKGADVNLEDNSTWTPLQCAASWGYSQPEICNVLINAGANINHRDDEVGYTALHWAVGSDSPEVCKVLINKGADITIKDIMGLTAWDRATIYLRREVPELNPEANNTTSR